MKNSLARLVVYTAFASLATACVEPALDKDVEPFTVGTPGKADGSGMLPPADMARLEAAFDEAVASGQVTIDKLEAEIATLEAQHAAKEAQISGIVQGIQAREAELKDAYEDTLVVCAFLWSPDCVFLNYVANDSKLKEYREKLADAQWQQQWIAGEIAAYRTKRDDLRTRIDATRAGKTTLLAMLRDDRAPTVDPALADSPAAGRALWKVRTMGEIEAAISKEIGLLVELRNAAVELNQTLDESITTLRALEQSVEALVEEARGQFVELLKGVLTGDPEAVVEDWYNTAVSTRTRELLATLEFPISEFARHLVESYSTGEDEDGLYAKLVHSFLGWDAAFDYVSYYANTPVNLLDHTVASSPLNIAERRDFSLISVRVDIEHTHVGDLVVTLEHAGHTFVLSDRRGLSDDSLVRWFDLPAAAARLPLDGQWTLHVEDQVTGDTGTLTTWGMMVF